MDNVVIAITFFLSNYCVPGIVVVALCILFNLPTTSQGRYFLANSDSEVKRHPSSMWQN